MRHSQFFIPTLRLPPKDADTVSAQLMIRSGMIRKLAAGLFDWLPLGLRVLKKAEQIVREEMNAAGGLEVWLPHVQPKELWEETGRWKLYGRELLRIKDRKSADFCFAPTAEEVITDMVRRDVNSYRQLPLLFYQFGTKFRDEIRPRFGVMRAREFYMKDAYSFHATEKSAEETYGRMVKAYSSICERCGLKYAPVEAETGAIGGNFSHEFMVLADTGEEEIAFCSDACGYAANVERAECVAPKAAAGAEPELPMEDVDTPNAWTVEDVAGLMGAPREKFIKTMFYTADSVPVVALIRGDCELNEAKLMRILGAKSIEKMSEEGYSKLADCPVGFAGPQGLKERCLRHAPNCKIVADDLVKDLRNAVSGGNKKDVHTRNVNPGRDFEPDLYADLRNARPGDACPRCAGQGKTGVLSFKRGIEVGHAFKLGTKYSDSMQAMFLDETGASKPFIMGCYGIGVSRVVAAAIEQNHDENGIIWTKELAPFTVIIVPVNFEETQTRTVSEQLYQDLKAQGVDVLLDDRPERAGIKFKDADLLGIPFRVTVSERGLAKGEVEFKARSLPQMECVPVSGILAKVRDNLLTA